MWFWWCMAREGLSCLAAAAAGAGARHCLPHGCVSLNDPFPLLPKGENIKKWEWERSSLCDYIILRERNCYIPMFMARTCSYAICICFGLRWAIRTSKWTWSHELNSSRTQATLTCLSQSWSNIFQSAFSPPRSSTMIQWCLTQFTQTVLSLPCCVVVWIVEGWIAAPRKELPHKYQKSGSVYVYETLPMMMMWSMQDDDPHLQVSSHETDEKDDESTRKIEREREGRNN